MGHEGHTRASLTAQSPAGLWGPGCAKQCRATVAAAWPAQWLSLVLHRDVQQCLPVALQPSAQICGCPIARKGFVCTCLEQLEWIS